MKILLVVFVAIFAAAQASGMLDLAQVHWKAYKVYFSSYRHRSLTFSHSLIKLCGLIDKTDLSVFPPRATQVNSIYFNRFPKCKKSKKAEKIIILDWLIIQRAEKSFTLFSDGRKTRETFDCPRNIKSFKKKKKNVQWIFTDRKMR